MRPLPFIRTVNVCVRPRGRSFFLLTLLVFLTSFHAAFGQNPTVPQGASASFPATGTEAPAGSVAWDIVNPSSQIIATNDAPNGWNVVYSSVFTVAAPAGAVNTSWPDKGYSVSKGRGNVWSRTSHRLQST